MSFSKTIMKKVILLIVIFSLFVNCSAVIADSGEEFEKHMSDWNEKKELASQFLLKAEKEFLEGDELSACATQKEASEYGMSATKSLMLAMEVNGSMDSMENLEAGLNKWKEIGEMCSSFFN